MGWLNHSKVVVSGTEYAARDVRWLHTWYPEDCPQNTNKHTSRGHVRKPAGGRSQRGEYRFSAHVDRKNCALVKDVWTWPIRPDSMIRILTVPTAEILAKLETSGRAVKMRSVWSDSACAIYTQCATKTDETVPSIDFLSFMNGTGYHGMWAKKPHNHARWYSVVCFLGELVRQDNTKLYKPALGCTVPLFETCP